MARRPSCGTTRRSSNHTWECSEVKNLGLSLADGFQFFVCHVCALRGANMTHNKHKVPCCRRRRCCERKSYLYEPCLLRNSADRKRLEYRQLVRADGGWAG